MSLTSYQRRVLTGYRNYHANGSPMLRMYLDRRYLLECMLLILLYGSLAYAVGSPVLTAIVVGYLLGGYRTVLGHFFHLKGAWPIVEQITDWNKVDELLARPD